MCKFGSHKPQKTHDRHICGSCVFSGSHKPQMGPPCVFLVHINHKKHMVEANVAYVRHKNTYGRAWHPFMCYSVVHMSPNTTTKGREKLISPSYTFPSRYLPLTTPNTPPPNPLVLSCHHLSRHVLASIICSCLVYTVQRIIWLEP